MESTEKNSKRGSRSTRIAVWGVIIPALVIATVMLLFKLEAGKAKQWEAEEERLEAEIRRELALVEAQDDEHVQTDKEKLKHEVQALLNKSAKDANLQFQCVFVDLAKESSSKYVGIAELANEDATDMVAIEVTTNNEGHLLDLKILEPHDQGSEEAEVNSAGKTQRESLITSVKNSGLSGYEQTTIGRAFDTYFESPKWELKVAENGVTFVEFSGKLKEKLSLTVYVEWFYDYEPVNLSWEKGETVFVRFAFSHDFTTFDLWSVKLPPTPTGMVFELEVNNWQDNGPIMSLLNEIYAIR